MPADAINNRIRESLNKQRRVILNNADKYIEWLNSASLKSDDLSPIMSSTWKMGHEKSLIESLRQVKLDVKFEKLEASLNKEENLVTVWLTCPGCVRYLLFI